MKIPDFTEFASLLHDRIHALVHHYVEMKHKFTIITNLIDRELSTENEEILIYAGADTQRRILDFTKKGKGGNPSRNKNWTYLADAKLTEEMKGAETFRLLNQFREGQLSLQDIKIGNLGDYFAEIINPLQENEYPILNDYFDTSSTSEDAFLSIPIISFGEFEGVAHLVFQKGDKGRLNRPDVIRSLIKLLSNEYEAMVLDWEDKKDNIQNFPQLKEEKLRELTRQQYYLENNPVLSSLNFKQYYESSQKYHYERLRLSEETNQFFHNLANNLKKREEKLIEQYRQTAIITILIDSYSHNVSAHSLTTLNWWFRERAFFLIPKNKKLFQALQTINPLLGAGIGSSLAREIQPLFKFLLEKGAFWSGITRKTNFGGKISSLFSILWFDFFSNPLYLGTIANTEGVSKINFYITIYSKSEKYSPFYFKKIIQKNENQEALTGHFVSIDLWYNNEEEDKWGEQYEGLENKSRFVRPGTEFDKLYHYLKSEKVFFPGGVVGKHAFFTILENEIRNVKHYNNEVRQEMKENGLDVHLSFEPKYVHPSVEEQKDAPELFQAGIWLGHKTILQQAGEHLILKKMDGLQGDIMHPETFQPTLGGNFQDKICAAMLFNREFASVQNNETERDMLYYPWITSASTMLENPDMEFVVSPSNFNKDDIIKNYQHKEGYLKKYFHVWRGAEIYEKTSEVQLKWENVARFKIAYTPLSKEGKIGLYERMKARGVIRVIQRENVPGSFPVAYREWLRKWVKKNEPYVIDFVEGKTEVGRITYKGDDITFENKANIEELSDEAYTAYTQIVNKQIIKVKHGGGISLEENLCNYRTHGVLLRDFFKKDRISLAESMIETDAYELFELLNSRICIFDNRIFNRIATYQNTEANKLAKLNFYRDNLYCDFRAEKMEDWESLKSKGWQNFHFLIVHLSFIEKMTDAEGKAYGEKRIGDFIKDHILQGKSAEEVEKNFVFVVTTGRGRTAWWKSLEGTSLTTFTTFRPIETLISGVEDAIQMQDDIDLKFNLIKVLFGS